MQMIKKVIGILLICSSIVCVYSIECNNGNLKEGKCVCSTGYTGPDCSLHICPKEESFSIYPNNAEGAKARQLESGEENYQNSNMELIVSKTRILSVSGIKVTGDGNTEGPVKGMYKVTFESDLGLDKTGGSIKCTKNDKTSSFYFVYGKLKEVNTYYVEKGLTANDECIVISKRNDFSLLLKDVVTTDQITCNESPFTCDVTITGLGTLFNDMEITITDGNIAFKTSDDNKIYTGIFKSKTSNARQLSNNNSSRILADENLILTITSDVQIDGAGVTITPYLLINSKLDKLSIENSEIGYYINNLGDDGLKLTKVVKVITTGNVDIEKVNIYKVSDVKYDGIGINGGKLSCNDIYGNKFTGNIYSYNSEDKNYFIEFDNDKTDFTTILFSCEVISTENDLSLLLKDITPITPTSCTTPDSNKSPFTCDVTITGLGTLFAEMGIDTKITDGNIAFTISDDNKIYTGIFKSEVGSRRLSNDNSSRILAAGDLILTITSDVKIEDGKTISPYLLINSKLDKLLIENSEIGYYINDLGDDGLKLTKVVKVITTGNVDIVNIYKVNDVKYDGIGINGGKLSCNDIYGNKFTGIIYSYNSEDKNYYIEFDNEKTDFTTILFSCEVISTENDLSLLLRNVKSTDQITCTTVEGKSPFTCNDVTITGLGTLFSGMEIDTKITDGNIAFKTFDNKIYTGTFTSKTSNARQLSNDNSSRILADENLILTITSNAKIDTSTEITPYLLINANGNKLSIENSELYENIQCDSSNQNCELIKGEGITQNTIVLKNDKIVINLNNLTVKVEGVGFSFEVTVYEEALELFNKYFREGLSLIDDNGMSVRIVEVKKKDTTPRLLLENKRLLLDGSEKYKITTKPSIRTLSTSKIYWSYDIFHPAIECSGQGECDRTTGNCKCYDGFSGNACQRLECPNRCNGNGECVLVKDILTILQTKPSDNIYGCKCTSGYRGYDCSLVECPSGKDPDDPAGSNKEKRDCSGRGICDYTTGTCKCFQGYGGNDCSKKAN